MSWMGSRPLLCRLRLHTWEVKYNEEGKRFQECRRCHANRDQMTLSDQATFG